jgi:hypothetical protein
VGMRLMRISRRACKLLARTAYWARSLRALSVTAACQRRRERWSTLTLDLEIVDESLFLGGVDVIGGLLGGNAAGSRRLNRGHVGFGLKDTFACIIKGGGER